VIKVVCYRTLSACKTIPMKFHPVRTPRRPIMG
jgi:hypothetical protein